MSTSNPNRPITELRVALTTGDYERLVTFYCDGLGMEPAAIWNNGQGHAVVLNLGNATLEIFDQAQAETIDEIEAGERTSGQIRFALQVPDLKAAIERLIEHGATLVHPPIITPWGDYNVRLQDPTVCKLRCFRPQQPSSSLRRRFPTASSPTPLAMLRPSWNLTGKAT